MTRPEWQQQSGDDWHHCESLDAAAEALPIRSTVFLALGSQHLAAFFRRDDVRFIIRMIDPPNIDLPFRNYSLILGRPGQSVEEEEATFRESQYHRSRLQKFRWHPRVQQDPRGKGMWVAGLFDCEAGRFTKPTPLTAI